MLSIVACESRAIGLHTQTARAVQSAGTPGSLGPDRTSIGGAPLHSGSAALTMPVTVLPVGLRASLELLGVGERWALVPQLVKSLAPRVRL